MRLTILSRDFPPAIGGIGDHTDRLATELAARAVSVTVVCSAPAETRRDFEVRPVVAAWTPDQHAAIVEAAGSPDAVLWQYNPFAVGRHGLAAGAGRLARSLAARAPLTLLLHELWFPWGRGGARGLAWAVAQRAQTRAAMRAASRWIVTTEQREELLRRIDATKTRRVPIGANVEPSGGGTPTRPDLGIPPEAFLIAHIGSAGPGRDLPSVFEALRILRARSLDARLLLAGNTGPLEIPSDLVLAVSRTGILERSALSAAIAAADAAVHVDPAGASAGRRGSLVAAMAHGLPIVAFRGPDHASELVDGGNVVLAPPSGRALAEALEQLARHPDEAARIGRAARETYDLHFSWPRITEAILRVLTDSTR